MKTLSSTTIKQNVGGLWKLNRFVHPTLVRSKLDDGSSGRTWGIEREKEDSDHGYGY